MHGAKIVPQKSLEISIKGPKYDEKNHLNLSDMGPYPTGFHSQDAWYLSYIQLHVINLICSY